MGSRGPLSHPFWCCASFRFCLSIHSRTVPSASLLFSKVLYAQISPWRFAQFVSRCSLCHFSRTDAIYLHVSACAMCSVNFARSQTNSAAVRAMYIIMTVPSFRRLEARANWIWDGSSTDESWTYLTTWPQVQKHYDTMKLLSAIYGWPSLLGFKNKINQDFQTLEATELRI